MIFAEGVRRVHVNPALLVLTPVDQMFWRSSVHRSPHAANRRAQTLVPHDDFRLGNDFTGQTPHIIFFIERALLGLVLGLVLGLRDPIELLAELPAVRDPIEVLPELAQRSLLLLAEIVLREVLRKMLRKVLLLLTEVVLREVLAGGAPLLRERGPALRGPGVLLGVLLPEIALPALLEVLLPEIALLELALLGVLLPEIALPALLGVLLELELPALPEVLLPEIAGLALLGVLGLIDDFGEQLVDNGGTFVDFAQDFRDFVFPLFTLLFQGSDLVVEGIFLQYTV